MIVSYVKPYSLCLDQMLNLATFSIKLYVENGWLPTHRSAHKLVPDFGAITRMFDILFATGMTSLDHPIATQTSSEANALR